ncbi:MAG TPA: hypothetical protein VLD86_08180 [Ilumatobacteraceae bacterium]|nr:hypothetical protein [Ilumatobacteraceae bacterium]
MSVSVTPQQFTYVGFDASLIQRITEGLLQSLELTDHDVHIEVDETTPLARVRVNTDDKISIRVESGALEDPKHPRQQSETTTTTSIGRVLLRVKDRLHGGFGDAPADDQLTLAQMSAWDTYCVGRLGRMGVNVNQQRWRYNFRNRHGFTDAVDVAFDRIWNSDHLTWDELLAISMSTTGA